MEPALVLLVLTFVTPPSLPDIHQQMPQNSVAECWDNARAFVEQGVPAGMKARGVTAVMAGCLVRGEPEEKL